MGLPLKNTLNPTAIKALRESRGLTQQQAGRQVFNDQYPAQTWNSYERGRIKTPRQETLLAMAKVLQCGVGDLMQLPDPASPPPPPVPATAAPADQDDRQVIPGTADAPAGRDGCPATPTTGPTMDELTAAYRQGWQDHENYAKAGN